MIAQPRHHLVPGQAQAVEEEKQEYRRVRYELRCIARSAADWQDHGKRNGRNQQADHRIDA